MPTWQMRGKLFQIHIAAYDTRCSYIYNVANKTFKDIIAADQLKQKSVQVHMEKESHVST